ncbi:MAG TPA: diphthine--ammonia ligase [Myxococcaceae bacterium]|nr:diphthine--ammonia ligase [Myxococcaceae bacterium]
MTTRARPKAIASWSSGKDSAFALHESLRSGEFEIVGILTTVTEAYQRVAMHGVRTELLDRQADALGLPCIKVPIPSPCPNDVYEREMSQVMDRLRAEGVTAMIFGDLFLEDIRAYREARLREAGFQGVFPLWKRDTRALAREMVASGLQARLTCIDPRKLDPSYAGRLFDHTLLHSLPSDVDPCGENGEFHTLVTHGPMFREPIEVVVGEIVTRDGFVFADILPA